MSHKHQRFIVIDVDAILCKLKTEDESVTHCYGKDLIDLIRARFGLHESLATAKIARAILEAELDWLCYYISSQTQVLDKIDAPTGIAVTKDAVREQVSRLAGGPEGSLHAQAIVARRLMDEVNKRAHDWATYKTDPADTLQLWWNADLANALKQIADCAKN